MALRNERLAFIGCGTMGEAMIKGLLRERLVEPDQIVASHPREDRVRELAERYGVRTTRDNGEAASGASVVTLSIKPQFFDEATADLAGSVDPAALVVSIIAGIRIAAVVRELATPAVARVMPNTPGQIGRGISVWTASDAVDEGGRERVRAILTALGSEEYVTHEDELDMATALSGTGPAYVFLFMEALIDAGVHLGFSRRVASRLVYETVRGSVEFAEDVEMHIAKLRNQVTSPGGTSAEALYQLEKGTMRTVLSDAVWAAYRRCVQLGAQVEPDHNGRPFTGDGNPG
jgi:pyrroline-5-carboxylate reductase